MYLLLKEGTRLHRTYEHWIWHKSKAWKCTGSGQEGDEAEMTSARETTVTGDADKLVTRENTNPSSQGRSRRDASKHGHWRMRV